MPATTVGRLLFKTRNGPAACTATVISAPNHDTIWTAGHCVSDGNGHWYTDFSFRPDTHDGINPYGTYRVKKIAAPNGWANQGKAQYDMAAMALFPRKQGKVQDRTGAQGWKFGGTRYTWNNLYIFGYPGERWPPYRKLDAKKLRYCTYSTSKDTNLNMMHYLCDMGRGSSGGPLIYELKLSRGWGYVIGDASIAETNTFDRWSPQLGAAALNTYKAVKNA